MKIFSNFVNKDDVPGHVATLLNTRQVPDAFHFDMDLYPPGGRELVDAECARFLGGFVDEWIASGRNDKGNEEPLKRHLTDTLFQLLEEWINRTPAKLFLSSTGEISTFDMPLSYGSLEPTEIGQGQALFFFAHLLNSHCPERLARCSNPKCGIYYVRQRLRKNEIKRGAFCGKCVSMGSSERTKISREVRKKQLIELAADVLLTDWKPTLQFPTQSDWVAAKMNKENEGAPITRKWVSQNRPAIEAEVERRKHAKG